MKFDKQTMNRRAFITLISCAAVSTQLRAAVAPAKLRVKDALFLDYDILDCGVPTKLRFAFLLRSDDQIAVDLELRDKYGRYNYETFKSLFLRSQVPLEQGNLRELHRLAEAKRDEVHGWFVTEQR